MLEILAESGICIQKVVKDIRTRVVVHVDENAVLEDGFAGGADRCIVK
jgi:hypothetical protein